MSFGMNYEEDFRAVQMRQQAYRATRSVGGFFLHEVSHRFIQRLGRITQMVLSPESRQGRTPAGPEPPAPEDVIQFGQVEVHHEQPVLERVLGRLHAPVSNPS